MAKEYIIDWLIEALEHLGGRGSIIEICKYVWENYEQDLHNMGDIFYTWQYDIRWAATELRKRGKIKPTDMSPQGIWELSN
ncbi:MAG: hypothetical protein DRN66_02350 [Candidatus Nanohalarchaeota archaeon]|nr:MAG: hypothetical protein DRN66_02350 [Candidatus Nanohaloarchaeota archaeon]